jgi:hypothetical protein
MVMSERKEKTMSKLSEKAQEKLPASAFAFPEKRKEPLVDARHVQNAIARFDQVEGVSNAERDAAWKRIKEAARTFSVELQEEDWRDLYKRNHRPLPGQ